MRGVEAARNSDAEQHRGTAAGLTGVVRGFGILAGASLLGQAIGFFALVYVAHRVGPRGVGQYNFVLAIVSFFGLFGNLGLDTLAVRAIASGRDTRAITSEILTLKLAFAAVAFAVLLASRSLLTADSVERSLVPIVGLNLLIWAVTLDWRAQAMRRFGALGLSRLSGQIAYGALVPVFVVTGAAGVRAYAWLNVLGLAVTMVGLGWIVARQRRGMPSVPSVASMRARLASSLPFIYALAMLQLYVSVDIVMLGHYRSAGQVGIYAVANRLPGALIVLANVWINAFFPHAAAQIVSHPRALLEQVGRIVTAMAVLGIGLVVGTALLAEELITSLFGGGFTSAGAPFAVLVASAAVTLVDVTYGNVLQAAHGERSFARAITLGVLVNVGANLVLIPAAGALGAAISTLIAELVLGAVLIVTLARRLGVVTLSWKRILRGLAAAGLMAGCVLATRQFGVAVAAVTATVTFTLAALSLGAIDPRLVTRVRG
jgi:O-antigen/teichoic acid export membrane protein